MKKEIRNKILAIRDQIPSAMRAQKDLRIQTSLFSLPEFLSAGSILLYASFRSEVATPVIIKESLAIGKRVLLPKVDAKNYLLKLYQIENIDELVPGYMGIPEPDLPDGKRASIDDAELAVIPGAAFDLSGNRLGYGGGYYDILLASGRKRMPLVALSYEEQLVRAVPFEGHDVRVDVIITDERTVRINR
jgi:5-formyltetrahydrofolate cyclo-ligase